MRCKVIIADETELFSKGLRALLESDGYEVVGEAPTGAEALEMAGEHPGCVMLLDLQQPGADDLAVMQTLERSGGDARSLVLSASLDHDGLFRAISAGARGYVAKDCGPAQLFAAIDLVCEGGVAFSDAVAGEVRTGLTAVERERTQHDRRRLHITDREYEILRALPTSRSLAQIAADLFLSKKTVQNNVSTLYRKLGVSSRQEAVASAIQLRLILRSGSH